MENWAKLVSKNRRKFLVLILILNLISLLGLFRLNLRTDVSVFFPEHSRTRSLYDKMLKEFGEEDQVLVSIELSVDPLSVEGASEIERIAKKISEMKGVRRVVLPFPERIPVGFRLVDLEKAVRDHPDVFRNFVERFGESLNVKGKNVLLILMVDDDFDVSRLDEVLENVKHYVSGNVFLERKLFDYVLKMVLTIPPIAVILLLMVFRFQLKSMKYAFLSLAPAGFAALWVLGGVMGWSGLNLSVLTVLVPIFTIVMGSADGVHFVSHFIDAKNSGMGNLDSVIETLKSTGRAMILTTLTTMAGFFSLLTVGSGALSEMGILAGIGVGLAGVSTWIFLPAVLVDAEDVPHREMKSSRFNPRIGTALVIVIVLAFAPGIFKIESKFDLLSLYKDWTEVKKNVEMVGKIFGGALPSYALRMANDPYSPDMAEKSLEIEGKLENIGVKSFSIYDLLSKMNEFLFGEKGYPRMKARVTLLKRFIPSDLVENFVSGNTVRMVVLTKDISESTLDSVHRIVEKAGYEITGIPYLVKDMNESIVPKQVISIITAVGFVFIILIMFQRDLKVSLKSLIPIILSLISLFGFMGTFKIPLNIITANMAGIVIGVGIDYAIHVVELHRYYSSVSKAVSVAMKPIFANAFGLSIGLSALLFSPFTFHTYLVGIMWVTMTVSSLSSLFILPGFLEKSE